MTPAQSDLIIADLIARAGQYVGRGVDSEGRVFLADLELSKVAAGKSVSYRFRAQALAGSEVYHDESGLIGVGIDGQLALMASSNHYRHVFLRGLSRVDALEPAAENPVGTLPPRGGSALVFAFNDSHQEDVFRDEIRLSLYDDGRVGHDYAWGLAGGPFAPRSNVVLTNVTAVHDERPVFIRHYEQLREPDNAHYSGSDELLSIGAPIGRLLGLERIGIHIETLPTGRRTSYPHAEMTEEEFVFVLSGHPEVWIDGDVYRLRAGDAVGFKPGNGIAHTFINNAPEPARLVVIGERARPDNKIWYPLNPERRPQVGEDAWWTPVKTALGPHDGLPDRLRPRSAPDTP